MNNFEIAKKYVDALSINIKKYNDRFIQFSCPICGEGSSHKWKARGFVLISPDAIKYHCHNDCGSLSFYEFLEHQDGNLANQFYKEYKLDKLKQDSYHDEIKKQLDIKTKDASEILKDEVVEESDEYINKFGMTIKKFDKITYSKTVNNEYIDKDYEIQELTTEAIEYLESRGFKKEDYKDYKYCKEEDSIVIPFWWNKIRNEIYGFQARCINTKMFHNQNFRNNPKVTNLGYVLNLPKGTDVYCFEAEFDRISTSIDNSIAIIGKTLSYEAEELLKDYNLIMCTDADEEGDKSSLKYAYYKKRDVLIHKEGMYKFKDCNKLLEVGQSKENITKYVMINIRKPTRAIMELRQKGYNI